LPALENVARPPVVPNEDHLRAGRPRPRDQSGDPFDHSLAVMRLHRRIGEHTALHVDHQKRVHRILRCLEGFFLEFRNLGCFVSPERMLMQRIVRVPGGGNHASPIPSHGVGAGTAIGGNGTLAAHGPQPMFSRSSAAVGSVLRGTSNTF